MHIPSLVKIHLHLLKLLSGNENTEMRWAHLKSKPDLQNINAYTKFGANPLTVTQLLSGNENKDRRWADNSVKNRPKFYQVTILNQISTISMHIPSLAKNIRWYFLKLSSRNETRVDRWTDLRRTTDGQTDRWANWCPKWNHNTTPLTCGRV